MDDRTGLGGGAGFVVSTPLGGSGGGTPAANLIISELLAVTGDGSKPLDNEVKLAVLSSRANDP